MHVFNTITRLRDVAQQIRTAACRALMLPGLILVLALMTQPAFAQNYHWSAGSGLWGSPGNWLPFGVPGPGGHAWIGSLGGVEGHTVFLNQDATVLSLSIMNDMGLQSSTDCCGSGVMGHQLAVNGVTSITDGGRLVMFNAGPGVDFETSQLLVDGGDSFFGMVGSTARINDRIHLSNGGRLTGLNDTINNVQLMSNGTTLINDGGISQGMGTMTFSQIGGGLFDLDGTTGNGRINVGSTTGNATMVFQGGGLTDSFSGEIQLGNNSRLVMYTGSWVADVNSLLTAFGAGSTQRLHGDQVTLAGDIRVYSGSEFFVEANANLSSTANMELHYLARTEFVSGTTTNINGATFDVGERALLDFNGATNVSGGNFSTFLTPDPYYVGSGAVRFNGATNWSGAVNINGLAQQIGDATINSPVTIHANVFDMHGNSATTWNISSNAVINAAKIDLSGNNDFTDTMNITGGFLGRLILNLDDPNDHWAMAGTMNLSGVAAAAFPIERLAGSHMRVSGDLNINHRVRIAADTTFTESSQVTFAQPTTLLQMTGRTHVMQGADFVGAGTLENGTAGDMTLGDGANMNLVGMTNRGRMQVGHLSGVASVDRFIQESTGAWLVELGGYLAGVEHDLLIVSGGTASLDGQIEVDLLDLGGGTFLPEIGDTFTILSSLGGVVGSFLGDPVTQVGSELYHWSVVYNPHDVQLQLTKVTAIPESSTLVVLAGIGLGCCGIRRRRS